MIDNYGNEINWIPKVNNSKKPLYKQIAESIEKDIQEGILKVGHKLPPQRIIANYLNINHSTVTRAYKLCEENGLIKGITGRGTFVTSSAGIPDNVLTVEKKDIIEMGAVFPLYEINEHIEADMKKVYELIDYELVLKYSPPEGHKKHRYIASQWLRNFGIDSTSENILISSGSQNALAVILTGLFTKGERIIVDAFTYTGIKSLASLLGIILVPVKSDKFGMDVEDLKKVCQREKVKGIYLIPNCHNPSSMTMPLKRREDICKVIKQHELVLIEDGTFSFTEQELNAPLTSLLPDQSFYIHGTSKAFSPSFRISYIVSPKHYVKKLTYVLNSITWMVSPINAEIVSLFIKTSMYEKIVQIKLKELKKRNIIFDELMKEYQAFPSETSLFRYLRLPDDWDDMQIENECYDKGVQVFSSKRFSVGVNTDASGLRIAISAPKDQNEMKRGLKIIKDVLDNYEDQANIIL